MKSGEYSNLSVLKEVSANPFVCKNGRSSKIRDFNVRPCERPKSIVSPCDRPKSNVSAKYIVSTKCRFF